MLQRVLLAEDEPGLARTIEITLRREGLELTWVRDGVEALAAVAANPPALILLDVGMPRLDGFEVLRRLKTDPETAEIPVIMLTGRSEEDAIYRAWTEGVEGYLTKPFDPRDLREIVERSLAADEAWEAE
ncbi:MAG: response regulator [Fimbriimonadaceae bacterium]|nr:response regulator [Fimbriimonadaceae bacterium]